VSAITAKVVPNPSDVIVPPDGFETTLQDFVHATDPNGPVAIAVDVSVKPRRSSVPPWTVTAFPAKPLQSRSPDKKPLPEKT